MGKAMTKTHSFFDGFVGAADAACKAAEFLLHTLTHFDNLEEKAARIHEIEHEADKLYHETLNALNRAFITPIEAEDIRLLASSIDDVVDAIDDIVIDFYIYDIQSVMSEALEFAELIVKICHLLRETMHEFRTYKKSAKLKPLIIEVNDKEEVGDRLYQRAVRKLFTGSHDAVTIMKWRAIFEVMEACCDACENVTDVVESVMLKNS